MTWSVPSQKLGGNVLLEPAAAMVHMFSLVMFGLCSPCSLTNQWDKLPIDPLEVYFPKWELPWWLIWAWRFGTPVPLYYYVLWALIKVWNPYFTFLLHTVGTDHQGVEPLSYFSTSHCGHWSPRCGTTFLNGTGTYKTLTLQLRCR